MKEIIKNSQGIMQMPCPEALFKSESCGIGRNNHGVFYYENIDGFTDFCYELAAQTADMAEQFIKKAKARCVVMGIEHSPTCAVNYMYAGRQGTVRRKGIYISALAQEMQKRNLVVDYVGINRKFPKIAIKKILELDE